MNEEKKVVFENGIYTYILSFFCTVMPMLTIPYVTRCLGTNGYGEFSVAFNLVNYFQIIVEYGFALHGTRKVAISKETEDINKCFSNIFTSRVILYIISLILMFIYLSIFIKNKEIVVCCFILFLMVLGSMLQQNWLLQGLQKMKYITAIGVVSRLVSVVLIFSFVRDENDVYLYCLLYALTNFLVGVSGLFFVVCKLNVRFIKVSRESVITELKEAVHTFISILGSKILGAFGITVLGLVASKSDVGIYSAVYKIPNVVIMLFSPISQVVYPYISKKYMDGIKCGEKIVVKIAIPIMLLFSILSVGVWGMSETVVGIIFGEEYIEGHIALKILMIWVLFSILNNFLGIQTLVASNHSKEYGNAFMITVVIAFVANIVLVQKYNGCGVAIALLLSELSLTLLLLYKIFRINMKVVENT